MWWSRTAGASWRAREEEGRSGGRGGAGGEVKQERQVIVSLGVEVDLPVIWQNRKRNLKKKKKKAQKGFLFSRWATDCSQQVERKEKRTIDPRWSDSSSSENEWAVLFSSHTAPLVIPAFLLLQTLSQTPDFFLSFFCHENSVPQMQEIFLKQIHD